MCRRAALARRRCVCVCVVVVVVGHRAADAVSSKAHATVHVCPAPLLPPPHRAACFVLQAATPESNGGRARARAREREGEGEGDRVRARVRGRERERERERGGEIVPLLVYMN